MAARLADEIGIAGEPPAAVLAFARNGQRIARTALRLAAGRGHGDLDPVANPCRYQALKRKCIRLIHRKTDVEVISNATTISKLREKAGK
jgi:hypothetical protein